MKTKTIILFVTLLVLLVGVVSASDLSDDATTIGSVTEKVSVQQTQEVSSIDTQINEKDVNNEIQTDISSGNGATATKTIQKDTNSNPKKDAIVDSWSALGDAIDDATTDATITLSEGGVYDVTRTITLDKQIVITIDGNGQTIYGTEKEAFKINSGSSLVLKNITIKNTKSSYGGTIYNKANLTITDTILTNNTATNFGGVIYNLQGNIIINNSTLQNNTASKGGVIYNENGTVTITQSTLQNNSADIGGIIYNRYNTINITNSIIENNHANNMGGVIYNTYGGTVTVTKILTLANTADNKGGAIYNDNWGTVNIDEATLVNNSANLGGAIYNSIGTFGILTINSSVLNNNNATSYGGAIYNGYISMLNITDSIIGYNQAESGGAITNIDRGRVTLTNTHLTHNSASYEAGAIYNNQTGTLTMRDVILEYNTAYTSGVIYNNGTVNVTKATFSYNNASGFSGGVLENDGTFTITESCFNNNTAYWSGGAIDNNGKLTINDTSFEYNTADITGGAIVNYADLILDNATFKYNAASRGGAISNDGILNISSYSLFENNNARSNGGAIYNSGNLTIKTTTLNNNIAEVDGGAIYNDKGNLTINDTNMTYNEAGTGGAIYNVNNELSDGTTRNAKGVAVPSIPKADDETIVDNTVTIIASRINNNNAVYGGAIKNIGIMNITDKSELNNNNAESGGAIETSGNLTITNSTLKNNTASVNGGAIKNIVEIIIGPIWDSTRSASRTLTNQENPEETESTYDSILSIADTTFEYNNASVEGGAVYNEEGVLATIISSHFNDNIAYAYGGAIENYGIVDITKSTFENNTARNSGAIDNDATAYITDSNLTGNTAEFTGGAIINWDEMLTITGCIFNNNSITGTSFEGEEIADDEVLQECGGGAIFNEDGDIIIFNTNFTANHVNGTTSHGGAIYNTAYMSIDSARLENNNATRSGGAIYNKKGILNMTNVILNNNTATDNGGALSNNATFGNGKIILGIYRADDEEGDYSGTVIITNSTITNNAADEAGAISNAYGNIIINDTHIENNNASYGGAIENYNANMTITNATIVNNTAKMVGGAILNSAKLEMPQEQMLGLSKTIKSAAESDEKWDVYSNIIITNSTLNNNNAFWGGVIFNAVIPVSESELTEDMGDCYSNVLINGSTLKYNNASYGGAIYNTENGTNLNITNSTIEFNNADNRGGAVYHEDGLLNINTTVFTNNTANIGSAIHNMGNATIYNNTFKTNKAASGESAIVDEPGTAVIRNNINDKTSRYYSTIYTYGDDVSIIKNIFDDGTINTTITITTNNTNPTVGDKVRITFTLKGKDGKLLSGQKLNITVDGKAYNKTTNSNGIATVDYTLASNMTKVTAKYGGYYSYNESNDTKNILAKKINTKLALTVSNAIPVNNTAITVTATLTDINNKKLANQNVTLNINGKTFTNKTNANGVITQKYTPNTTLGTQTITATYNGSDKYNSSTNTTKITVKKINTKLSVKASNTTPVNSTPINITVTLTDVDGNKLSGQNVTITVGGKTFNVKTNASGVATQSYTPTKVETQTITATYKGDSKYVNTTASTSITVKKTDTKLAVKVSNTTPVNSTAITITATLTDASGNKLANQNITINVGGKTFTNKTNTNGVVTQSYTPTKVETQTITATFKGDSKYNNSTATTNITVTKINTKLAVKASNTSPVLNASINITATLTDASGNKLSGQNVTLTIGGKTYTVKTNSNGVAIQSYTPTKVETQKITATYNGDSKYTGSTATSNITVRKIDTKLTLKVSNSTPVNNTQISITATLTDANNNKLANQVVTLNVNGKTYNVTTNKEGVAMLNYTPTKVESQTITATYKGNSQDNNSTATTKITVINKYNTKVTMTPSSGVIGEKLTLKATVFDQNNAKVTDGNVIFKINGVTIKDNGKLSGSSNPLKVKVVNGVATATITPDVSMKSASTITASYVGTDIYNKSTSSPVNITISPRNATIEITLSKKIIKQGQVLTITARVYDTTNGKKSTNLTAYPDEYVFFKVNGITLKDANNQTIKVKLVNGVATINYTVPLGIAGIMDCKTMAVKNHTIVAGYYNKNYDTVSQTPTFQVERSNLTLVISNVTANNKTHKLSLKVTVRDYLGNVVEGPNKFIIKLNGFSITNGTEPMYYYSVDGILSISNIDIPVYNVYNYVEVVTQDRLAYTSQRNTTTKIKVLN